MSTTTTGTKERLLEAAWAQVREGGVGAATSRAITDAAGANLGAITYHFGSKDALLAEALVRAIRDLVAPALEALQEEGVDSVGRFLNAVARLQAAFEATANEAPAYLEALVQVRHLPELRASVQALFADLRGFLSAELAVQQRTGALPRWLEPDAMAGLLLAVAQGVVLQTVVDGDGPDHPAMAAQFAHLILTARTADQAPSKRR